MPTSVKMMLESKASMFWLYNEKKNHKLQLNIL